MLLLFSNSNEIVFYYKFLIISLLLFFIIVKKNRRERKIFLYFGFFSISLYRHFLHYIIFKLYILNLREFTIYHIHAKFVIK